MSSSSSSNERKKKLNYYFRLLASKGQCAFPCPKCEVAIIPKNFESHCRSNHDLNSKRCCVWCLGQKAWSRGPKYEQVDHLLQCFRQFWIGFCCGGGDDDDDDADNSISDPAASAAASDNSTSDPATSSTSTTTTPPAPRIFKLLDVTPIAECRQFFDHENISEQMVNQAFAQFNVLRLPSSSSSSSSSSSNNDDDDDDDDGTIVDYFLDENLNRAASYVRMYMKTKDRTKVWYHLMVKAGAFDNFFHAVLRDGGNVEFLPFSCWCDGGGRMELDAEFRQHRHMIVVYPKNYRFDRNVWDKVRFVRPPPGSNIPAKRYEKIKSPLHLVNTLSYVCKRQSRCRFTIDGQKKTSDGPLENKHFYIFETLPKDHLLPLCVQWDGGIERLMFQEKFKNVSVARLMNGNLTFDGNWKQKIRDFYGFEGGMVLPFRKEFGPVVNTDSSTAAAAAAAATANTTTTTNNRFCYLINDRKIRLGLFPEYESLDDESWLQKQVEGGNCFYDNVGQDAWTPRKRDQEKLNLAMPLAQECRDLKRKRTEDSTRLKTEHELEMARLKSEYDGLKSEYDAAMNGLNENREENERLRTQLGKLRLEIATLKRNIIIISNSNNNTLNMSK